MTNKFFTILSAVFFIIMVFPILGLAGFLTTWGDKLLITVLNISLYLPLIFGGLGLIFGLLGEKGQLKKILVLLNILGLCLWGFLLFIGIYGFQQP